MLHAIPPDIHPERIPRHLALPARDAHQARDEIGLGARLTEGPVARHGALVDEADDVAHGADVVRQVALRLGPQREHGQRVHEDDDDERVEGRHGGHLAHVLGRHVELGGEEPAREHGQREGEHADEGDPRHAVVARERGAQAGFEGELGRVAEEEGLLGRGAAGVREAGEGLERAVVGVNGLPGEEEKHAEEGGEEAVEEVGGREAEGGGWRGEEGQEAVGDGVVQEADHEEGGGEDEGRDEPEDPPRVAQEPRRPSVAHGWGVDVCLEGLDRDAFRRVLAFEIDGSGALFWGFLSVSFQR